MRRLLTAVALLAVAFYLVFLISGFGFAIAAVVTGWLCYQEYSALVVAQGIPNPGLLGLVCGAFVLLGPQFLPGTNLFLPGLAVIVFAAFIAALRFSSFSEMLPYAACTLFGAFYAFSPWRFAIDLRSESVHLLFFALALNWAGDSAAFFVGRKFGKHLLAPRVSPKKSREGAIASVTGSVLFGLLYLPHFVPNLSYPKIAVMALAASIAGQLGDLAESALKRAAGVKDSGTLLPGHGGALDRLDSSMFALPVVLVLYRIFGSRH